MTAMTMVVAEVKGTWAPDSEEQGAEAPHSEAEPDKKLEWDWNRQKIV